MPTFRPNPRCLLTELQDETAVVLHLDTKFYYTLNPTGVFIWKQLTNEALSCEALATRLCAAYDVDLHNAIRDVEDMVATMLDEDLIAQIP